MKRFLSQFGSLVVLLALCAYYSIVTIDDFHPETPGAGRDVAEAIIAEHGPAASVLIIVRDTEGDRTFAAAIEEKLKADGANVVATVFAGDQAPADARAAMEAHGKQDTRIEAIATHNSGSQWGPLKKVAEYGERLPALKDTRVHSPASYRWPSFMTRGNLLNVINQNADVAIIAIGMTLVIITAGIDLSVGSLVALSGVLTAVMIEAAAGGASAGTFALMGCALVGILACGMFGAFTGVMVTLFRIPAFVVTLALMEIARGLALKTAVAYKSSTSTGPTAATPEAIPIASETFKDLSAGDVLGIPNPIILMFLLYFIAHIVMTRTSLGRYIYAVGGNKEAARLSGVPVFAVLISVYAICGLMSGLAGVIDASKLGGRPNAGGLYELRVIAAVVVGGTSLMGGEGRIMGTLIGAMIIAVIHNGLNMAGVQSYDQMIIFGLLILAAALVDSIRKHGRTLFR
jgi:ribose transport system permease protein